MSEYKIFSVVAGSYEVHNTKTNEISFLKGAGKLRYHKVSLLVGDNVKIKDGLIIDVIKRHNSLIRPKVANIDQAIIFMSIQDPEFSSFLVDKYLSLIEFQNIKPIIFITKVDLNLELAMKWKNNYQKLGYDVYLIDNLNKLNDNVKKIFSGKYSLFMGQSGVGKTTTINNIGQFKYHTQEISKALGRGKHTTRVVKIIKFLDGFLIDTPGFSSIDINLNELELAKSYTLFKTLSKKCKYRSCLHLNENKGDCAIKLALNEGQILDFRYENYVKLQRELKERRKNEKICYT
ncbi:ribosome small subunit-dependent GTPase A [Mycoplasmopsis cynos]|uniref:ribosome small subunit-dependent GTPase A n=1 Tax=Mycoplasmopsis cynos TaxID=171284 RepID=UPI0030D2603A